jgi:hypothetical protein
MFRGVRQDDTGTITWPSAEVGLRLRAADRGLTSARVRVGTWNSLHSGWAGADGPSGKRWYESDVYTTLSLGRQMDRLGSARQLPRTLVKRERPKRDRHPRPSG